MKFFIPAAASEEEAESVYSATKSFAHQQTGFEPSDRRIYGLAYRHEGKDYYAEVGAVHSRLGETVVAILETPQVFFVCTANRSVLRGEPMLVGKHGVKNIIDFEK
ncbi:MAG: hypothetical protein ABI791_04565 [Acidobacteriota bacterium]